MKKTQETTTRLAASRRQFAKVASAAALLLAAGCSGGDDSKDKATNKKEKAGMNFDELKEARRSVRQYAKSEITKEELEKIVTDALNAPSWKNTEATRYYAAATAAAKERMWKEALPGFNAASSANAAALVAVTYVPGESGFNDGKAVDDLGNTGGAYDCGLASSYFILAAKNRGWDTLIMGMRDVAKVKEILGIPKSEILMSVIAVGKSAQKYMKRPRKPVAEVLKVK